MKQWWKKWQWLVGICTFIGFLLIGGITFGGAVEKIISNSDKIKEISIIDKQVFINTYDINDLKDSQKTIVIKESKQGTWQIRQEERINNIVYKLDTMQKTVDDKFKQQQAQLNRILDVLLNGK